MKTQILRNIASILIMECLFTYSVLAQKMTEILGRPTNSSVTMNILFDYPADVYFEYGTVSGNYTQLTNTISSATNTPIETEISGLQSATRYYYRTRYRKTGDATFQASAEHTFITQRKPGNAFRFTIEADPHPYDKKGCWPLWDIALANQLKDTADFMIDMGDTFGDDHNPFTITNDDVRQLQLNCRDFFGKVCHSLPFYFCIGNHEGECGYYLLQTPPSNLALYETLWRKLYFPNPFPNSFYTGSTAEEPFGVGQAENYYAWEWGDALIVVLDVYRYATKNEKPQKWDFTIGKEQYDWFKKTLETSKAKYKMVFTHHILGQGRGGVELAKSFEWGGYDAGTYKFDAFRPGWGVPLHQLMVQNKVDIFFQGHDHIYVKQDLDGIVYQSVPMPSDSSYKIGVTDNGDAYLTGTQLDGSGHLRVTVCSDSLSVQYVSAVLPKHETSTLKNGQIRHTYSIKKSTSTSIASSIDQDINGDWTVFPNPASDECYLNLHQSAGKESTVRIFNIEGKIVSQLAIPPGNESIVSIKLKDSAGNKLKPGIYLVSMLTGGSHISSKKIVVQ